MDKKDIIRYCIHTKHNLNPNVLDSMLDEFAESNGGSGDESNRLTTATLNLKNETGNDVSLSVAYIMSSQDPLDPDFTSGIFDLSSYGEIELEAILIKHDNFNIGFGFLLDPGLFNYTTTGDIRFFEDDSFLIDGDCSITFTSVKEIEK